MKLLTFKGGIHPPYNKEYTNQIALKKAENQVNFNVFLDILG